MNLQDRFKKGAVAPTLGSVESWEDDGETPKKQKEGCYQRCVKLCPSSLAGLVESEGFDYTAGTLVVLNVVLVGVRADYALAHVEEEDPFGFQLTEMVFCILFVIEMLLRVSVHGHYFFTEQDWRWNLLDFTVVGFQAVSEILEWTESSWNVSFGYLRVLRSLRIIRMVRLARLMHFIRELRPLVASVAATLKSLCWTMALIGLMIYMIGVLISQVIVEQARHNPIILHKGAPLEIFYGSLGRTLLSLYQAMTGGVDWDVLVTPLINDVSPLFAIVFCLYIGFAVLAMMNVITGLFVDSALRNTRVEDDIDMVNSMRDLFNSVDIAQPGQITWCQFQGQLSNPRMDVYFKAIDLDVSEARGLFKLLDLDESGSISVDEFVMGCLRLRGGAKAIDLATLMYDNRRVSQRWFRMMDSLQRTLEALTQACVGESPSGAVDDIWPFEGTIG